MSNYTHTSAHHYGNQMTKESQNAMWYQQHPYNPDSGIQSELNTAPPSVHGDEENLMSTLDQEFSPQGMDMNEQFATSRRYDPNVCRLSGHRC